MFRSIAACMRASGFVAVLTLPCAAHAQTPADQIYQTRCQSCHGSAQVAGSVPRITADNIYKPFGMKPVPAEQLATWIRLNMPTNDPGSLSKSEAQAVTVQLLAETKINVGGESKPAGAQK